MFDRPVFGWLPWAPGVSKKFVLSGNVLTISWPLMANTKKITFEKKLPTFHRVAKNLKNLTLKTRTFRKHTFGRILRCDHKSCIEIF
jgi:hypothetical protein